jgi:hypothetical protein
LLHALPPFTHPPLSITFPQVQAKALALAKALANRDDGNNYLTIGEAEKKEGLMTLQCYAELNDENYMSLDEAAKQARALELAALVAQVQTVLFLKINK